MTLIGLASPLIFVKRFRQLSDGGPRESARRRLLGEVVGVPRGKLLEADRAMLLATGVDGGEELVRDGSRCCGGVSVQGGLGERVAWEIN